MKSKLDLIPRIKELYSQGENIIQHLRECDNREHNTIEDILISYDFQAGSYVEAAKTNSEYLTNYSKEIAEIIFTQGVEIKTILEAGVGEATTLCNVLKHTTNKVDAKGFDISWSRISVGKAYLKENSQEAELFVADLFQIPLENSSIDVVYSSHSIEPNGGREAEAISELYRVCSNFLILLEPTYEFATEEGKARMKRNGYVMNLKETIEQLGLDLIYYSPFKYSINSLNPTGLYIIRKSGEIPPRSNNSFCCPISQTPLKEYEDHFFSQDSLLSYPKIGSIPCLLASNAILTTKHG